MGKRDERNSAPSRAGQAKPDPAERLKERRIQDAIEDDEMREALGVPHQPKRLAED